MKKSRSLAIQIVAVMTNVLTNEKLQDRAVEVVEELLDQAFDQDVEIGSTVVLVSERDEYDRHVGQVLDIYPQHDGSIIVEVQFTPGTTTYTFCLEDVRTVA